LADDPQQQSVHIRGWGKRLGFSGPNAFPWLVILLLIGGAGYMVNFSLGKWGQPIDIEQTFIKHNEMINKAIADHTIMMNADHKAFKEATEENTYTLAACLRPRQRVECPNIMMPDSLRRKLRRQE
jgi:hypothetical protein